MGDQWADLPLKGSEALPAGSPRPGPTVQIGGKETLLAVVGAGNSIATAARSFAAMDYNVTFQLVMENYTNKHLYTYQAHNHSGHIKEANQDVRPGMKEGLAGHKSSSTATGCTGTVAWKIGTTNKMVVVMYSVPYSHDWHSNWCGVGIFDVQETSNFFEKMYNDQEVNFKRKDFYRDQDAVTYRDADFEVNATMGTSHKSTIQAN